jgi:hypothetical protein
MTWFLQGKIHNTSGELAGNSNKKIHGGPYEPLLNEHANRISLSINAAWPFRVGVAVTHLPIECTTPIASTKRARLGYQN